MNENQTEQELKSERVQEELALVAEGPFRISLKAERVQAPSALAVEPAAQDAAAKEAAAKEAGAIALNLELSGVLPVTITLIEHGTIITI